MKFEFSIDESAGLVREYLEGEVTIEDILEAYRLLREDDRYHTDISKIVDLRHCTLQLSFDDLPKVRDEHIRIFGKGSGRIAYLVNDPKTTALTMLFKKQIADLDVGLFSTEKKALEWMGLTVAGE